eukprot:SAG31_NODE_1304_length_8894_cov_22.532689_4_plen_169_part_00
MADERLVQSWTIDEVRIVQRAQALRHPHPNHPNHPVPERLGVRGGCAWRGPCWGGRRLSSGSDRLAMDSTRCATCRAVPAAAAPPHPPSSRPIVSGHFPRQLHRRLETRQPGRWAHAHLPLCRARAVVVSVGHWVGPFSCATHSRALARHACADHLQQPADQHEHHRL